MYIPYVIRSDGQVRYLVSCEFSYHFSSDSYTVDYAVFKDVPISKAVHINDNNLLLSLHSHVIKTCKRVKFSFVNDEV